MSLAGDSNLDGVPRARLLLVVALFGSLPYLPDLGHDFLTWDDNIIILSQPFLRTLTAENLWKIVSPLPAREEWLPLRDLTLLLNFVLFGPNPLWFAAFNILLHAATSVLLCVLFERLQAGRFCSFLGAVFFACHAVHVESVTWLSGRKDPLAAIFIVLALIAHIRYREGRGRYLTTVGFLALALLSKASAFVFPLWAIAYDSFYRRELRPRARLLPIAPYAVLALGHILLFTLLISKDGVIEEYPKGGLPSVLLTNVVLLKDYTLHVLFPLRHQAIYDVAFLQSPWSFELVVSTLALGTAAAAAFRFKRHPWVPFSMVLFYSSLFPYLNLIPHGIYYAERYLYLPSISFSLAAGKLVECILTRYWAFRPARIAVAGATAVFIVLHVTLLAERSAVWADSETFWSYQAKELPMNPAPLMNLGETFELEGRDELAKAAYEEVLQRFGAAPEAFYRLARVARRAGDLETARASYRKAASLAPDDPRPINNLAETYLASNQMEEAIVLYGDTVRKHPRYLLARANLARTLEQLGRGDEACIHWRYLAENADLLPQEDLVKEARSHACER